MRMYRLRVELADLPGRLAAVASVIADSGANIASVDIHEVEGPGVVDELVVHVPESWEPGLLAERLATSGAGILLSAQVVRARDDTIVELLATGAAIAIASEDEGDAATVKALLALTHAASAMLLPAAGAAAGEAGRTAVERGLPIVMRERDDDGRLGWTLAVPDDAVAPETVAIVRRPMSLPFSSTESARVEALLRMRRRIREAVSVGA